MQNIYIYIYTYIHIYIYIYIYITFIIYISTNMYAHLRPPLCLPPASTVAYVLQWSTVAKHARFKKHRRDHTHVRNNAVSLLSEFLQRSPSSIMFGMLACVRSWVNRRRAFPRTGLSFCRVLFRFRWQVAVALERDTCSPGRCSAGPGTKSMWSRFGCFPEVRNATVTLTGLTGRQKLVSEPSSPDVHLQTRLPKSPAAKSVDSDGT